MLFASIRDRGVGMLHGVVSGETGKIIFTIMSKRKMPDHAFRATLIAQDEFNRLIDSNNSYQEVPIANGRLVKFVVSKN